MLRLFLLGEIDTATPSGSPDENRELSPTFFKPGTNVLRLFLTSIVMLWVGDIIGLIFFSAAGMLVAARSSKAD